MRAGEGRRTEEGQKSNKEMKICGHNISISSHFEVESFKQVVFENFIKQCECYGSNI